MTSEQAIELIGSAVDYSQQRSKLLISKERVSDAEAIRSEFKEWIHPIGDCLPLMPYNQKSRYSGTVVRGRHPDYPVFDPEPCRLPPLPTGRYRSIFASQKGEHRAA